MEAITFRPFTRPGDPVEIAMAYAGAGADELMLVNRGAALDALVAVARRVTPTVSIPVAVAADPADVAGVEALLDAGVARIALEASALRDPAYIAVLAGRFGPSKIGVAITALREGIGWRVLEGAGGRPTEWEAVTWASVVKAQGGGQVVIDSEGGGVQGQPFDLELLASVTSAVDLRVVAAGEASSVEDVFDALMIGDADAALVGSLLHSGRRSLAEVKEFLAEHGLRVRL